MLTSCLVQFLNEYQSELKMGLFCCFKTSIVFVLISVPVLYLFANDRLFSEPDLDLYRPEKLYFGPKTRPEEEDASIRPFKVDISDEVLLDLQIQLNADAKRLKNAPKPVEGVGFNYGFDNTYLQKIVSYWKDKFSWRSIEKKINNFPQFMTNIDGVDFHFVHAKPAQTETRPVLPLLMVHGWPGSFLEFLKIIPMLTNPPKEVPFAFEVVSPSLPGYGFSSACAKSGCDNLQVARMFKELMERLGHDKFYAQGGDWGGITLSSLSILYPSSVIGYHTNFATIQSYGATFKSLIAPIFPSLFANPEEMFLLEKMAGGKELKNLVIESGYLHLQATKPDTLGASLTTSPSGLAAWLLEKFSTATNMEFRNKGNGGLTEKFTWDELLSNVMLYWVTSSGGTAARFYLENFQIASNSMAVSRLPIHVPSGVAIFPHEFSQRPRSIVENKYRNLVSYGIMPRGGHFAAMEEPHLLAHHLFGFVKKVREMQAKEEAENKKKNEL